MKAAVKNAKKMQKIRATVAEAAALADVPVELVLLGKTVRVCHEKAGFKSFGMTGTVTEQKNGPRHSGAGAPQESMHCPVR